MARWGSCDYRKLRRLQQRLEQLQEKDLDAFCRITSNELASRLLRRVKLRTPVDSGELRRRWDIGEIRKNGDRYEIEIINPMEYSSYVEFGHRTRDHRGWVKGRFMLTISEQELKAQAPELIQRKLYKFLKEELGW